HVADRTLERILRRERGLGSRERRRVSEAVYGILRSEFRNDALLRRSLRARYESLDTLARGALHYEIWRLSGTGLPVEQEYSRSGLSRALLPGVLACLDPRSEERRVGRGSASRG